MKKELKMNKLNVVCGALVIDGKVMIAQEIMVQAKVSLNFLVEKLRKVKQKKRH